MKEEIIQKFLKEGKLLTPDALTAIEESGFNNVDRHGLVVTKNVASTRVTTKQDSIRILKNITTTKQEISVEDFARFYKSKYDKMKNIIASRLQKDFISLNKLDNYRDEVYAIGIVRDIREKDGKKIIDLEDPTAVIPIVFEKELADDVEVDDAIAVRAVSARNTLFGKQVIFPDAPLRQPTTGAGRVCFAPSMHLDEVPRQDAEKVFAWLEKQDINNIFFAGDIGDKKEFETLARKYCYDKNIFVIPGEKDSTGYPQPPLAFSYSKIINLSNPAVVEINGVKILIIHNFGIGMLKKRYLGKPKTITDEDQLPLEDAPDIVLFNHYEDTQITNYKSVTIANPGSLMAGTNVIVIDLSTRDAQQITV